MNKLVSIVLSLLIALASMLGVIYLCFKFSLLSSGTKGSTPIEFGIFITIIIVGTSVYNLVYKFISKRINIDELKTDVCKDTTANKVPRPSEYKLGSRSFSRGIELKNSQKLKSNLGKGYLSSPKLVRMQNK